MHDHRQDQLVPSLDNLAHYCLDTARPNSGDWYGIFGYLQPLENFDSLLDLDTVACDSRSLTEVQVPYWTKSYALRDHFSVKRNCRGALG